jgi:sec-independent protein translocase protein TatB
MFNIGGGEFLVIALIALIVLGPQRLPDAARQAGKAMGELRRLSSGFQNELKEAFTESETVTPTTGRRDVLASPVAPPASLSSAVSAVSSQPRARRTPLKAASPGAKAATNGSARPKPTAAKTGSAKKAPASTKAATAKQKAPGAATTSAGKTSATKPSATKRSAAKTSAHGSPVPTARRPRTKGS